MAIRVLIVDDYEMVRRGLMVLLSDFDDLDIVGQVSDGDFAVSICQQVLPDVVLMDINMPRMSGIEATRRIRAISPKTQVIALTSYGSESEIQDMLQAGAISFLVKNLSGQELYEAISRAHLGQPTLSPESASILLTSNLNDIRPRQALEKLLTDRELEVLREMTLGLTNNQISLRLDISYSTVKNHVSNIMSKLQVKSRAQAVVLAVESGIRPSDL